MIMGEKERINKFYQRAGYKLRAIYDTIFVN
jgi:hypothetical protein